MSIAHQPHVDADGHPVPTGIDGVLHRIMRSESAAAVRKSGMRAARVTYGTQRPFLPHRYDLATLLNRRALLGCGVEVGVKEGKFSEALLSNWRGKHLISVDPWAEAAPDEYVDMANVQQNEHDRYYAETVERLAPFGDRSTIWRTFGAEAAERIPHHALDFVYLDARHDRASVLEDLGQWHDKVRPGGVLAGHDYIDGRFAEGDFGVRSAVDEFFGRRGLRVGSTRADGPWLTWYVLVPA